MRMETMTWDEVENYLTTKDELIIPVGTCEQHGRHLPLNNDTIMAEYMADYLSKQAGIIIAPTINYGINLPCDKYMYGTTTLKPDILKNILLSLLEWWEFQGFRKFYIITFHGDPFHVETLSNIKENLFLMEPWEIEYSDILEKQQTIKHACEAETSAALYLYPEKVRFDNIEEYDIPIDKFIAYLRHERDDKIENYVGCLGFPSKATKEKGKIIVNRMKDLLLKQYEKFSQI
jgi:creatinine amidohydrolase